MSVRAAHAQDPDHLFGLDAYIGGMFAPDAPPDGEPPPEYPGMGGWQTGASLRFIPQARWLGVTVNYARHSNDEVRVRDLTGGLFASTPWLVARDFAVRGFAHALAGAAWGTPAGGATEASSALVLGAGLDMLLVRLQFDYVRTPVSRVPRNQARVFIGGFVPLCFRGCRADGDDGFDLSGGR